ncbi:MAG: hypothetical protein HYV28_13010 [Ignavibacteriales bacterium]|nr:hypothetical protein [Ignavibacteriales bacterium]
MLIFKYIFYKFYCFGRFTGKKDPELYAVYGITIFSIAWIVPFIPNELQESSNIFVDILIISIIFISFDRLFVYKEKFRIYNQLFESESRLKRIFGNIAMVVLTAFPFSLKFILH